MTRTGDHRLPARGRTPDAQGYAMVALLVGLSIMAVVLTVALPSWRSMMQREREAELVFRGEQYARAIALYQRKFANAFPPNLDVLVDQKFLRRKYLDPITNSDFQLLYVGQTPPGQGGTPAGAAGTQGRGGAQTGTAPQQGRGAGAAPAQLATAPVAGARGGIMGVTSKSDAKSMREYKGRTKYNEWVFVAVQTTTQAGAPTGGQTPQGGVAGPGGARGAGRGGQPNGPRGGQPPAGRNPFGGGTQQPFGGQQPFGAPRGGR